MKRWFLLFCISLFFFLSSLHSLFAASQITINEFVPHPSSGEKEWVEFYNPDGIDLSDYWIDDDTSFEEDSGSSSKKSLSDSSSSGYYSIIELSSLFNNSGDSVVLFDEQGNIIDQFSYDTDPGINSAMGRTPDGNGSFAVLATASKGNANSSAQPSPTNTQAPTQKPTATTHPTAPPKKVPTLTVPTLLLYEGATKSLSKTLQTTAKSLASNGAYPTAILGTVSATKKPETPSKKVLVKDFSDKKSFPTGQVLISVGGLMLCACGIIFFIKKRRKVDT